MDPNPDYERVEALVRSVEAPAALRERISAERDRTLIRRMVIKRMKLTGVLAGAAAALGIAVGLLSLAGSSSDPSSLDAARLAARPPVAAAPAVDPEHPRLLRAEIGEVTFPSWDGYDLDVTGQRSDELGERKALTVFYDDPDGARLGYTIVEGEALDWPERATRVLRKGVEVHVVRRDGRLLAFWRVKGQTCIISAPESVGEDRVVALASYDPYA